MTSNVCCYRRVPLALISFVVRSKKWCCRERWARKNAWKKAPEWWACAGRRTCDWKPFWSRSTGPSVFSSPARLDCRIKTLDAFFFLFFVLCSAVQVRQRHGVHRAELLRAVAGAKPVSELFAVVRRGGAQLPGVLAAHGPVGPPVAAVSGDDVERHQLHHHRHLAAR